MRPIHTVRVPADIDPEMPVVPQKSAAEVPGWFQRSANVRRIVGAQYLICALLLAVDLFYTQHFHSQVEERLGWFGFYCLYGFAAFVVLVFVAKGLRAVVMRPEVPGE